MAQADNPCKLDDVELTAAECAIACHRQTCAFHSFVHCHVVPIIVTQQRRTDYEDALAGSYYRMALVVGSLTKLDSISDFQTVQAGARTVFELLLDLKMLAKDPALAGPFFAFAEVQPFSKAAQLTKFLDENPTVDRTPYAHATRLASDPAERMKYEAKCIKYWGKPRKGTPKPNAHWSNKGLCKRAKDAGPEYEEIYRGDVFTQNYCVHAGAAGVAGFGREAIESLYTIGHHLACQLLREATEIIAAQFHLFDAVPDLRAELEGAGRSAFMAARDALARRRAEATAE